jgi:hypothetical protein
LRLSDRRTALVATLLGVAASLVLAGLASWRILEHGAWVTAARRVQWHDDGGRPIARGPAGEHWWCGSDPHMRMIVDAGRVWLRCTTSDGARSSLGLVDVAHGTGQLRWLLPRAAGLLQGLLPVDGGLAFVWRGRPATGDDEVLTLAIAGVEGWLLDPVELPRGELLGMGVVDATLELAVVSADADLKAYDVSIWRVPTTGDPVMRSVAVDCPRDAARDWQLSCELVGGYVHATEGAWRFVVDGGVRGPVSLREDGSEVPITAFPFGWTGATHRMRELDFIAAGVVLVPPFSGPVARLGLDERIEHAEPSVHPHVYLLREGGVAVERARSWLDRSRRVHPVDDGYVALTPVLADRRVAPPDASWDTFEYLSVGNERGSETMVARTSECSQLANGVPVALGDGYVVLEPGGCYITLDASLRRRDHFGVLDHLRMRGSRYTDWHEPVHAMKLGLVLFGLPLVLLGARVSRRARARPWVLSAAAWAYALASAACLRSLWPLLR